MKRVATDVERDDGIQIRFQKYQANAGKHEREFQLPYAVFKALLLADCIYCGRPSDKGRKFYLNDRVFFRANGVDRVDNDVGYTLANSVSCCWICNQSKCTENAAEWIYRIRAIAKRTEHWDTSSVADPYNTQLLDRGTALQQLNRTDRYHAEKRRNHQN